MRSDIVRIYRTLHTWTGIVTGLALFIAFYAGALTMFKPALERWSSPADSTLPVLSIDALPVLIQQVLDRHPEAGKDFTVHLAPQEHRPASMIWHDGAHDDGHSHHGSQRMMAGLDEEGKLITKPFLPSPMAELIDKLHQTAGIPGSAGHHLFGVYVMGVVSILYVLALVSGLILFLPVITKEFFSLRLGKSIKLFWRDAHSVIGITSLPFHLVIALTAIVFSLHDFFYDGLKQTVYGDRPLFHAPGGVGEAGPMDPSTMLSPRELLDRLAHIAPEFQARDLRYQKTWTSGASVRIMGYTDGHIMRGGNFGFAVLDPYSGRITNTDYLPGHQEGWITAVTAFFALHFGNYGGTPIRWVYFFLGLGGALLFYSGNLLWIESRRKKGHKSTGLLASATVGISWGSVAGVAGAMTAGKWLQDVIPGETLYLGSYYLIFLASVAWAFYAGASRAFVHLMTLCAVTLLAIPATGIMGLAYPELSWMHLHPETLAVDAGALAGGVLCLYAAWRARMRMKRA